MNKYGKNVSRGTQNDTQMGMKLKEAMGTQYGNHTGHDAKQYLEQCNPHSTLGIGKGDRNRGGKR